MTEFRKELATLINKYSKENGSNTPDYILAEALNDFLAALDKTIQARERWYGRAPTIIPAECIDWAKPGTSDETVIVGSSDDIKV